MLSIATSARFTTYHAHIAGRHRETRCRPGSIQLDIGVFTIPKPCRSLLKREAYGPWLAPFSPFGSREARAVNAFLRASQSKHLTLSPFNNVPDLDVDIRLGSVTLEMTGPSSWVVLL